jgi:preprotein translocase subunit SecB
MIELNCKIFFDSPKEIINKIHAEGCIAIIFNIIDLELKAEEVRKIILAEIPDLYAKELMNLITDLFHKSGFKEFKFKTEINFTNLYQQQFPNPEQKN